MKNLTQSELKKNTPKSDLEIKFNGFIIIMLVLSAYSFAFPTIMSFFR